LWLWAAQLNGGVLLRHTHDMTQADVKSSTGMTMGADAARLDTFKAVIMNEINAEMESVRGS